MLYDVIYHPFPINFQYVGVDSPAHIGILTGERPRFKRRTFHVPNLMHKLLKFIFTGNHCRPLNIVKMNGIQPGGGGGGGGGHTPLVKLKPRWLLVAVSARSLKDLMER